LDVTRLHFIDRLVIQSFDLATGDPIAQVLFPTTGALQPTRLIRWGRDGLALVTSSSLDIYSGPFVQ
jgi:hypothetical protein